jgi:hypothetical protein
MSPSGRSRTTAVVAQGGGEGPQIRRMPSIGCVAANFQSKLIASFKRRRAGSQAKTRYVTSIL